LFDAACCGLKRDESHKQALAGGDQERTERSCHHLLGAISHLLNAISHLLGAISPGNLRTHHGLVLSWFEKNKQRVTTPLGPLLDSIPANFLI
jgi:hypothetical protein